MAIQFNPKHTIAAHEADHRHEVEVFKGDELDTDTLGIRPMFTSFAERVDTAYQTVPDDCVLYRIKVEFFNTYMDCRTLRTRKTWGEVPSRHYFSVVREDLVRGSGSVPTFRMDYAFIRSISVICRFCAATKEQTEREVSATRFLPDDLNQVIVEYLYPKAVSHFKEEAEKQEIIWEVACATGFRKTGHPPMDVNRTIVDYLYP